MTQHRIYRTAFASVYPLYVHKAERKGRTQDEVDRVICWLTGYDPASLRQQIEQKVDFEAFFAQAPAMNPSRSLIKGVVCGVRVEEGAVVRGSVLMHNTRVCAGAVLENVVADKDVVVTGGKRLSGTESKPFYIPKGETV